MPHATSNVKVVLGTALFGDAADPQAKINTPEAATKLLDVFRERGYVELDTARAYPVGAKGSCEKLLGDLDVGKWATVDSKVTSWVPGSHQKEKIAISVEGSLKALKLPKVRHYS